MEETNMMSMDVFMKGKAADLPEEEIAISKRYLGADGQPVKFRLKAIPTKRIEELRKDCTTIKHIKGQRVENFDRNTFVCRVAIETTVYPNFRDPKLLESYKCIDPVDLAKSVLNLSGEYSDWTEACFVLNGYEIDIKEEVAKAKN